jgi:hypothetical protein
MAHDQPGQASNARPTSIEGCLSKSPEGNFILADNSGKNFQLRGLASQLGDFVGKEIQVNGMADSTSSPMAGAMSSPTSSASSTSSAASAPAVQFNVSDVKKLAETCPMGVAPANSK